MNFRGRSREEPEINLIPVIDVLLGVLSFRMLSTTYSKFTELQLRLPVADAVAQRDRPRAVSVGGARYGRYTVNRQPSAGRGPDLLAAAMADAAKAGKDTVVIVSADAAAPHQAVITVLEAARRSGLQQVTFAAQSSAQAGGR